MVDFFDARVISGDSRAKRIQELLSYSCGSCGIVGPADWCGASGQTIATLNQRKRIGHRPRGTVLFHQGDPVSCLFRLLDGIVLLRQLDCGGNAVTTHMVCAGQTLGFRSFVDGGAHGVSAVSATDVVLCSIPADVAGLAFSGNHALERVFARHVAAELSATEDSVLGMTTRPVHDRLLLVFARLYHMCGELADNGEERLVLPLLRADIAALAGIARETFSRAMHGFEAEGIMYLDGDVAVFPDIAGFRARIELIQPGFWGA